MDKVRSELVHGVKGGMCRRGAFLPMIAWAYRQVQTNDWGIWHDDDASDRSSKPGRRFVLVCAVWSSGCLTPVAGRERRTSQ